MAQPSDTADIVAVAANPSGAADAARRDHLLRNIPIEVSIVIGKAHPKISELMEVKLNSVLPLDSRIDDPVEIYVGTKLIARGELQEAANGQGNGLAVRFSEIVDQTNNG